MANDTSMDPQEGTAGQPVLHQEDSTGIDSGAPIPVAVDYVESQLVELWRDVAEAAQAKGGNTMVTTAQVLNLIVHAPSYQTANTYIDAVSSITGRHPARVIVTITDPSEGEMPVQAWVSIHCQLPPAGGRQVCCEQVSVAAGGESVRRIPAAVLPLLLPDLPVFIWWPEGEPFDDYIFRNLSDTLNRLIVDSANFESPEGTLVRLATQVRSQWPKLAVSDMNWGRLTPWREMVAGFFDSPAARPYLDQITSVTIEYSEPSDRGQHVNRSQALMLAGWLASRLDWEPVDDVYSLVHSETGTVPRARLNLRAGKRNIAVELNAVPWKSGCLGDLYSVRLDVNPDGGEAPQATFTVSLTDKQEACAITGVSLGGADPTERTVQMQTLDQADLLDQELEVYSHDAVYDEAMDMVGRFIRGTRHLTRSSAMSPRLPAGEPISAAQAARRAPTPPAGTTPMAPRTPERGSAPAEPRYVTADGEPYRAGEPVAQEGAAGEGEAAMEEGMPPREANRNPVSEELGRDAAGDAGEGADAPPATHDATPINATPDGETTQS